MVAAGRPTPPPWVLSLAVALVLAVRLLFIFTYPLNDMGGDASNYRVMLEEGTSSLVHAGGYPFLIGWPFRLDIVERVLDPNSPDWPYAILIAQHVLDTLVLVVVYRVAAAIYGGVSGVLALLLAGLNPHSLSATSATYPEWLQAGLLVTSLGALYAAVTERRPTMKLIWYGLAACSFTWCILVKFNAAVLAFVFVAAIAFDRVSIRRKIAASAVCGLVLIATYLPYLWLHHFPRTGASALTYDTAWVLLTRVQYVYGNRLDPHHGLNTRRWIALSTVLPPSYEFAGPGLYSHVDAVPNSVRAPYRAQYLPLLTAGEAEIDRLLRGAALPENFSVGLSVIPVAYYLGLEESNRLGTRVALDAIRSAPAPYARRVSAEIDVVARHPPSDFLPTSAALTGAGLFVEKDLEWGHVRLNQRRDYYTVPFGYTQPVFWWPGVRLFSFVGSWTLPPYTFPLLIGAPVLLALVRIVRLKRVDMAAGVTLLLAAMIAVLVVVSLATLAFRWKEARLILPVVSVTIAAIPGLLASPARSRVPPAS